jgi:hypothetical protein
MLLQLPRQLKSTQEAILRSSLDFAIDELLELANSIVAPTVQLRNTAM